MQGRRVGPYRLVDHIGSGGMGEVYRAWDERLKRWVAVKQVRIDEEDPDRRQRFRREARATAGLNHPTIVQIYDVVETEEGEWIVMEHVEGETVASLLAAGTMAFGDGLAIARQIAAGLSEAHARGIVHRDLKTENVMVTPERKVKILDFGLAKRFRIEGYDPNEPDTWKSLTGRIVGTSRAMSPEQAQGLRVDYRSDLFSLGTLYFEMFTGVSPFKGHSHIDTLNRVCTEEHPPANELNPELPRQLSDLIDRLLEKEPAYRPQSADEVMITLDGIPGARSEISETLPIPVGRRPASPQRAPEPKEEPTRPGRPLPPGGRTDPASSTKPFWRRFTLPPALAGILSSLQFLRRDNGSESFD